LSTRPLKPRRGFCEDEPWMRQGTKHVVTMNKRTRQMELPYYDEINLDADGKLIAPPAETRLSDALVFLII
jgi:hypothetical protein